MAAISGKTARIRYTSATATSSTDNAATLAPGGLVLSIDAAAKRYWDRAVSTGLKIYDGSTLVPTSQYETVKWPIGTVVLSSARSTGNTYTIDVESFTGNYLIGGRSWSADIDVDLHDVTAFSSTGGTVQWRRFQPGLTQASVGITALHSTEYSTGPVWYDRIATAADVVVELELGTVGEFTGYGRISRENVTGSVDGLTEEAIDLTIDDGLYWTTG
jgi:hypothetical protein